MQFVDYESGHRNRADVAARRAVLTGVSQLTGKVSEQNMQELETDIVGVTAHAGARPDHAEWQGKWYSFSGTSSEYPSLVEVTGYGTGAGLKGWNCRHDFYPVIPGISEPAYTDEELANIDPPPIEYNGKTLTYYECTQRQMETAMRKTKREIIAAEASGDEDMFTAKSILLRRQKEEYAKFSKAAKLYTQNERTQVYGFGKSVAQKARWKAQKALDKYAQYHYNKNGNIIVTDDWKEKNKPTIPQKYKPYAVIETKTTDKNGNVQIDRSYYDENGALKKQVHSGNHGKPKMHPYGQYGEHKHKYTWIDGQKHPNRTTEELDAFDKKENSDII